MAKPTHARGHIYSLAEVAKHNTRVSTLCTYNGKVYDLTSFLDDHPGGDDIILSYAGQDIGKVMSDEDIHQHSRAAYEMLEEFEVGELGGGEKIVSEDWVCDENFQPSDTDLLSDYNLNKFIDLTKPLLIQVWHAPWTKEYYLSQVHEPRHLKESARLFGSDLLEPFTRTQWWVVPMIWWPIAGLIGWLSMLQFTDSSITAKSILTYPLPSSIPVPSFAALGYFSLCFAFGVFIWTILEYSMHRFLFHLDYYLPDTRWAITLHFMLHGVHHYLPMDKLRLVMPPLLFFVLQTPFTKLAHIVFPKAIANGIISGAFAMYVVYDLGHYALHHTRLPAYLREMKRYHLAHHYKNFELGFGVTSKMWDYVFGTVLPTTTK
ncbi:oxidoreductase, putative [Cryptococcus deneoformans JEC21]|uniref:Ceramide very long chain fatty acid hydroxylase n=2 Tax=Cryptococcus deneoformans TaxID=40410 RepID=Q5K9V0_CRYD1|nr:oxidoreductase, putative [Cryptococcus neoformans var. neoformans JEC21]AAW46114.2 oxidoreductase, putative [Cryptococcus neoformans var. neoformans JEC21]